MGEIRTVVPSSLWQNTGYRRLWFSLLASAFAGQLASVTLSLAAATTLHATPSQVGLLAAMGSIPYVFLVMPAGVWLDRLRKLPVYVGGEVAMGAALLCVPLAMAVDGLTMHLLYMVAFVGACVSAVSGTAGQIVLTGLVRRDQLVEAHGKNRVASSFAEVVGPGAAGVLIKAAGIGTSAMSACFLALASAVLLRGLRIDEPAAVSRQDGFLRQLAEGVRFVSGHRLLVSMALTVSAWQLFQTCAMATQVLFATRELGLNEAEYGLCMMVGGVGTIIAAAFMHRLAKRMGPGFCMIAGIVISAVGWVQLGCASLGGRTGGILALLAMLACYGIGVTLIFGNMLALRQAITPPSMLGRMTSTMRWLTLFPAFPGALAGGFLAEQFGLKAPLLVGGAGAALVALLAWRFSRLHLIGGVGQ